MINKFGKPARPAILVILLLVGAFLIAAPNVVSAESEGYYTYSVSGGLATITGYTGPGGAITIPSTLGGFPTAAIENLAFEQYTNLTSVSIPLSVSSIGIEAFLGCDTLTSIEVNESNPTYSSLDGVLYNKIMTTLIKCPYGKSGELIIPNGVTSIGGNAFEYCDSLTSVTISDNVTSIGQMAFRQCDSLNSIDIPRNVTSIGLRALAECSTMVWIEVDADNPTYSDINGVLCNEGRTSLIQFPVAKTGEYAIPFGVKTIEAYAFDSCVHLTSVNMPDSVTAIGGYAFRDCTSLTSVTIGRNVNTIGATWGGAFWGCSSLTSITFLGLATPNIYGPAWIFETPAELTGHAYSNSNFPQPGGYFYGVKMGDAIDAAPEADGLLPILAAVVAIVAVLLVAVALVLRRRKK